MALSLNLSVGTRQFLTPQHVQYLKMLQQTTAQLETNTDIVIDNPMFDVDPSSSEVNEFGLQDISTADIPSQPSTLFDTSSDDADTRLTTKTKKEKKESAEESAKTADQQKMMEEYERLLRAEFGDEFGNKSGDEFSKKSFDEIPSKISYTEDDGYVARNEDDVAISFNIEKGADNDERTWMDFIAGDDSSETRSKRADDGDEYDHDDYPIAAEKSFVEVIIEEQIPYLGLSEEQCMLAEQILYSIESSGYLYESMADIAEDVNEQIYTLNAHRERLAEEYVRTQTERYYGGADDEDEESDDFDEDTPITFGTSATHAPLRSVGIPKEFQPLQRVTADAGEYVRSVIMLRVEPSGISARTLQECLLAQLKSLPKRNAAQKLAVEILTKTYKAYSMKHYEVIRRELRVEESYLGEALEVLRKLNPKPGGGSMTFGQPSIVPDFFVYHGHGDDGFMVELNDTRMPAIKINEAYHKMREDLKTKKRNELTEETKKVRGFLKERTDNAKVIMQALQERRKTMIKVMTAIVKHQEEYFRQGIVGMKPLIYKTIAEDTGLDISTVCRVVNGKYTETEFGIMELRSFFSESITGEDGEEISTARIKEALSQMIGKEPKGKPLSDQKLTKELNKEGFNVARRTVAKYREQLNIPVARLRKDYITMSSGSALHVAALLLIFIMQCFAGMTLSAQAIRYRDEVFSGVTRTNSVQYGSAMNVQGQTQTLRMNIYQPTNDNAQARPVMVLIHGGGFVAGNRDDPWIDSLCNRFARRGYVCASIDYRLGVGTTPLDFLVEREWLHTIMRAVQDARAAVRFFRSNAVQYRVDTSRIIMGGSSAGAITAIHSAYLDESEVPSFANRAVVGTLEGLSGNPGFSSSIRAVVNCWGAILDTTWIQRGNVPIVSVHCTTDNTVPFDVGTFGASIGGVNVATPFRLNGSNAVQRAAQRVSVPTQLYAVPQICHGLNEQFQAPQVQMAITTISSFLYTQLYVASSVTQGISAARALRVAPNPMSSADTRVVVHLPYALNGTYTAELYNMQGVCVMKQSVLLNGTEVGVTIADQDRARLASGVYCLRLVGAGQSMNTLLTILP